MTASQLYALVGIVLFVVGFDALIRRAHLLRKVLALNVMSSGVFLVIGSLASRVQGEVDPVPHALVITGIVVAVASTGFALILILRVAEATGRTELPHAHSE